MDFEKQFSKFYAQDLITPYRYLVKEWIQKNEPAYCWELKETFQEEGYQRFVVSMISQAWRNETEVKQVQWQHWLKIIVPQKVTHAQAILFIHGGNLTETAACQNSFQCCIDWALSSNSIVVEASLVPNQHLYFHDEEDERYKEEGRREDQIVAYTWKKYFETQDTSWPLQVPMTKAAIKAMDCAQEFAHKHLKMMIEGFMVAGLSKRGWTSWLVAAHDPRVIAVAPMVIDLLNLRASFSHHFDVYGKWSPAIHDYEDIGIQNWVYKKEFSKLLDLIEPYHYRNQLTMPKYIVNSSGDEFFLPDSSQFYFEDLLEPKYLRYVPNCSHNLFETEDALSSVGAFYQMVIEKQALPKFNWSHALPNQITIDCQTCPIEMSLWSAYNENARDFRYHEVGPIWQSQKLPLDNNLNFKIDLKVPSKGWQAYFVEFKFKAYGEKPLIFTTDVYVLSHENGV